MPGAQARKAEPSSLGSGRHLAGIQDNKCGIHLPGAPGLEWGFQSTGMGARPYGKAEAGAGRAGRGGVGRAQKALGSSARGSGGEAGKGQGSKGRQVSVVTCIELRHLDFTPSSQRMLRRGTRSHVPGDRTEGWCKRQDAGDPLRGPQEEKSGG